MKVVYRSSPALPPLVLDMLHIIDSAVDSHMELDKIIVSAKEYEELVSLGYILAIGNEIRFIISINYLTKSCILEVEPDDRPQELST